MKYLLALFPLALFSLPTLPHVSAGTASTAEENSALHVTASDRAIIDWESFSIGAAETVSFHQPSPSATVLNRVTGIEVSELMGALKADGHVYLVNPNGIIVSKEAIINTASFFAFTNPVSSDAFLKGELLFDGSSQAPLVHSGKISLIHENGKVFLKTDGPLTLQGTIEAREMRGEAGVISLPPGGRLEGASIALMTEKGPIYNEGLLKGGEISLCIGKEAPLYQMGTLEGKAISIRAPRCLQDGSLSADVISIATDGAYIETAKSKMTAENSITIASKTTLFSSGKHKAKESIHLFADAITLCASEFDASNETKGGEILIGGDFHGANPLVPNAKTTYLNGSVKISAKGSVGGKIIVWSDEKTECFGDLDASGVTRGGFIEVSGKELHFGGHTSVSGETTGEVLFDPQSIVVSSTLGLYPQYEFINPNVGTGSFGSFVIALSTGNVVVTSPNDNFGVGTTGSGAVYLYNGLTAALISTLNGSTSGDRVGSGTITALTGNGNYAILSPLWNVPGGAGTVGAVTWGNGTTGVSGTVSAGNSFLGSTAGDRVGTAITALANGHYVVRTTQWSIPSGAGSVGAVTWGNGTTGQFGPGGYGAVSQDNSFIGSALNDNISSSGVSSLTNSNYVVRSPLWDSPTATVDVGAATWGNGTNGTFGPGGYGAVSSSNSFIGSRTGDNVSTTGLVTLTNGNYVVRSANWDSPTATVDVGAATWGNGTNGTFGPGGYGAISPSNSFVGSTLNDNVSSSGVASLTNGNYAVGSANWDSETGTADIGATTWGNGTNGTFGPGGYGAVASSNSLTGFSASDAIGGVTSLTNDHYVASGSSWNLSAATADVGAVAWGNGTNGTFATGQYGTLSQANSITGSTASDTVSSSGVFALTNGHFVIGSSGWDSPTGTVNVGAVTWGNGTNGKLATDVYGAITPSNSITGSSTSDIISSNGIVILNNGNYVIKAEFWDLSAATTDVGAAIWGNGTNGTFGTGTYGTVSDANSFLGSSTNDRVTRDDAAIIGVPGLFALTNGNYVVNSPNWDLTAASTNVGAVTWGNGTNGTFGTLSPGGYGAISSANSITGARINRSVGGDGITLLTNGNYVIRSETWAASSGPNGIGAATWANGTNGTFATGDYGTVSQENSFIGSTAFDSVGNGIATALSDGNYLVNSTSWQLSAATTFVGAITWGNGTTGKNIYNAFGTVSVVNSITGHTNFADLSGGIFGIPLPLEDSVNQTFICPSPREHRVYVGISNPDQMTYPRAQAQTMTIHPLLLTTSLDSGDNVTIQANDDITISDPITVSASGSGGNLSAAAGKNIAINANITTDNGNFTLLGNATSAAGVVDAFRTAGTATIAIANGVTINVGSGDLMISLDDGAGKTFSDSGNITLGDMATLQASGGGIITVEAVDHSISLGTNSLIQCQHGSILLTAGEDITATGAATIQATGTGTITMVVDTLFPTSPTFGTGKFDIADVTLTTGGGFLRLYAGEFGISTFPPLINGVAYTPGSHVNEVGEVYYPSLGAPLVTGDPYIVFYKTALPSLPGGGAGGGAIGRALADSAAAISEPFQMWTPTMYGGYLGYDLYPPTWTAKDLNLTIPFLVDLFAQKEALKIQSKNR